LSASPTGALRRGAGNRRCIGHGFGLHDSSMAYVRCSSIGGGGGHTEMLTQQRTIHGDSVARAEAEAIMLKDLEADGY